MKKSDAISYFGDITRCARALNIRWQSVNDWPDELPQRIQDRIIAALVRQGRSGEAKKLALGE